MIAKVNTDENPEWAGEYGVQGIPTMMFLYDGDDLISEIASSLSFTGRIRTSQSLELSNSNMCVRMGR